MPERKNLNRSAQGKNGEEQGELMLPEANGAYDYEGYPGEMDDIAASPGLGPEEMPMPAIPSAPSPGQWPPVTIYPIPIYPGGVGNRRGYCTLRFLNAAVGYDAVQISIGNRLVTRYLSYGDASAYYTEFAGFKTVRVRDGINGRGVLAQERFLFHDGDVYTIAIVNGTEGVSMVLIPDIPCYGQMPNFACVRAVNLSYNSPALDVTNRTSRVVFEDLRFKTIAAYKQMMQGEQRFMVSETENKAEIFEMVEWLEPGKMYTLYIIGDVYGYPGLGGVFTEDYSLLLD